MIELDEKMAVLTGYYFRGRLSLTLREVTGRNHDHNIFRADDPAWLRNCTEVELAGLRTDINKLGGWSDIADCEDDPGDCTGLDEHIASIVRDAGFKREVQR